MNLFLNKSAWLSIGKGAALAGIGAALTYLYQNATGTALGELGPVAAAAFAVIANYIRKAVGEPAQ